MDENNTPKTTDEESLEDSPVVLEHGVGAPFVALFDTLEQPLMWKGQYLGELITDFEYVYKHEGSDTCTLEIKTRDPNMLTHPSLADRKPLMVQWGWTFPSKSPVSSTLEKIYIQDMEASYTEEGVTIRIVGTSKLGQLFTMSSGHDNTGWSDPDFLDFLDAFVKDDGSILIDVAQVDQVKDTRNGGTESAVRTAKGGVNTKTGKTQ